MTTQMTNSQLSLLDEVEINESKKRVKPSYLCKKHKWCKEYDLREITTKKGEVLKLCFWCLYEQAELKKQKISFWHKEKEEVTDLYVATVLRSGKHAIKGDIPKELIEVKRAVIRLKRAVKDAKKPLKVCGRHGDLFKDDLIKSGVKRNGEQQYKCKKCMADYHKQHYELNKLSVKLKHQKYRTENREKVKESKKRSANKQLQKYLDMVDLRKIERRSKKRGKD